MRIIGLKPLREFILKHPDSGPSLNHWGRVARLAKWKSMQNVREDFPSADPVRTLSGRVLTVFNIGGNKYRLIVALHYDKGTVYVRELLTHAEYGRNKWKDRD